MRFIILLISFFIKPSKPTDLTKLKEWLNKNHPIPKPKDLSYLDKMKRKRKYKPKVVKKIYNK